MEYGTFTVERLKQGAVVLLASAAIGPLVGCGDNNSTETASTQTQNCYLDRDCDGITDMVDRFPDFQDLADADRDGIPNADDITPYGTTAPPASTGPETTTQSPPPPKPKPSTGGECTPGLQPDQDADGIPDTCDTYYDPNNKDSDGDGIPDSQDDYPYDNDANANGSDDGHDNNYNPQDPYNTDPTK